VKAAIRATSSIQGGGRFRLLIANFVEELVEHEGFWRSKGAIS
jgi:hypothetical protein